MKNIFISALLLFTCISFAQQENYSEKWKQIDSLEIDGLVESADKLNSEILASATKKKDYPTLIKAKIYHYKFYQVNHENTNEYILENINKTISSIPSPYKNVLLSYKATFLQQYFQDNRWKSSNRSKIDNPDESSLETWSLETLQDSIHQAFKKSLEQEEQLIPTPAGNIEMLLFSNYLNRKYKPTLYDVLANKALDHYSNSSNFSSVNAEDVFNLNSPELFSSTSEFLDINFPEASQYTSRVKVLQTYQKLERIHSESKNELAKVFAQLSRLDYVNSSYTGEKNWQLYTRALDKLSQEYEGEDVNALILFKQAMSYYQRSTQTDEEGKLINPDFLQKAVELSKTITKKYLNSDAAQKAYQLISTITAIELDAKIPQILAPTEPGRIFISYKGLDTLEMNIYRVAEDFSQKLTYRNRDSIIEKYSLRDPLIRKQFVLPKADDFNNHSTEVLLPKLGTGTYLIYLTQPGEKEGQSYGFLQVTGITLTQVNFDKFALYRSFDRTSGEIINAVKVEFFNEYSSPTVKVTDASGLIKDYKNNNSNSNGRIRASKNGDTLNTNYWPGYYYDDKKEEDFPLAKTMLYLDRAIYRPEQKVYFKGILLQHVQNKTSTVPNEYVEVYVDDPNGEEIANFRLKTNKYGSFNGEFILPASGITGEFEIYAEEDLEEDSRFWNKILDNGNYVYQEFPFNVEEYKRPTFKVEFEDVQETFRPGDTAIVAGIAQSFMGAGINNTDLVFEVTRQKLVKRWWSYSYSDPVPVITDTITTDAKGKFQIEFPALADEEDLSNNALLYQYNIKATVVDVSGETRGASTSLKIGIKNLLTEIIIPETVITGDTLNLKIENTNLNDNPVPVIGKLKIYKLQGPGRILKERLWEAPEINIISEKEFKERFPEEPYASKLSPEEWPKGDLVYEATFKNEGTYDEEILISGEWKSGRYLIESESSNGNNTTSAQRSFEVVNPKNKYLPDHQRFSFTIQNSDFVQDGKVKILLQTAYKDLNLEVKAYDSYQTIFSQFIKLNGRKEIEIPLKNFASKELEIHVTGIKNNSAIVETKRIQLPQIKKHLSIETETFRNKIQPGIEETWNFSIRNENNAIPDAEILASMYDASLDQFVTQDWSTASGFDQRYVSFPSYNNSNVGNTTSFISTYSRKRRYRPRLQIFDRLDLFGFYFSRANHYQYRQYLSNKQAAQNSAKLTGNTRGRITNEEGLPLPGVNILIKGTSIGTNTNFDGEFALDTKKGDELIISYIGFIPYEYKMGKKKEVYVVLEEDAAQLEEVVTVGYGIQVMEDAEELSVGGAASLLRGKVAGVTIQKGQPGASSRITIRGMSSVSGKPSPIFVVDGKIVTKYDLNSEEIISVEILKGEAATSLYGARASNGVVIINTKKGLNELQNVEARKNLSETAFFFPEVKLGADGKLKFTFTSPEALTQWKLRLMAHTRDWTTGKYETSVLTQKELSVIPNPPRFLREGDTIIFKSKVSNLSAGQLTGTAVLQLFDAVTMEPIDKELGNSVNIRNFNIEASSSTAVSWELTIPNGIQAVTYRILAKAGDFSDGEENFLPVLINRMLVTESLPIFVRAGTTEAYNFENLEENTSATLDHHKYSLEYSSNPAWYAIQSLPYLMEAKFQSSEQIFASLYANSIAGHIMNSQPKIKEVFDAWEKSGALVSELEKNEELRSVILAETPWVLDAQSESAKKQRLAGLFDTKKLASEKEELLKKLYQMQNFSGAWPWFPGGKDNNFITRHILGGLGHLEELEIKLDASKVVKKAVSYLDTELIKEEKRYKQWSQNPESFYKSVSNLHYLYVRSFFQDEYPFPEDVQGVTQKILLAHNEDWMQLDLYNKGLLMMALSKMEEEEMAEKIMASLKETAVKSKEYGMYWKENKLGWYWYRAPIETQALLIEAFTKIGGEEEAVEEMKIWLLQNKRTNHWPTTKSTTEATYALLMQGEDWLQISDNTTFKIGGEEISDEKLAETEKEAGTGYLKMNWKGKEIDDSFSEVEVENRNTTAGYGGVYWQYFEDLDKITTHSESPLNVEKELYLNVSDRNGKSLQKISTETKLKTGDLVTVRLVVRSTTDMDFIHLKDMRASGFEPTNVLSEYKYQDGTAYYESTKDAATHFFFDSLAKGTYVLEYTVRANNPGNFSNGITLIESMYAPEFSGHTKGIRVNIDD